MENHPVIKHTIQNKILIIRGQEVMLDRDLAELYGVETGNLNKAVKRNIGKFPEEFCFQLTKEEAISLSFQSGSLKKGEHFKYLPYAFTEHGILMLSSVLRNDRADRINIEIIRVIVNLRRYLSTHKELAEKLTRIESKVGVHNEVIKDILDQIHRMIDTPAKPAKRIGFYKE